MKVRTLFLRAYVFLFTSLSTVLSLACFAEVQPQQREGNQAPTEIQLNVSDWSPSLKEFQINLFKELIRIATPEYGESKLSILNIDMSTRRSVIALQSGEYPFGFTTMVNSVKNDSSMTNLYRYPYLNHFLGLRKLIVRAEDLEKFSNIQTFAELQDYRAGQGDNWPDAAILRNNGINVVSATKYKNLFPMLKLRRSDFVPMSVLEIDEVMAQLNQGAEKLVVVPNLYIFYPFPMYLRSSKYAQHSDALIAHALEHYFSDDNTSLRESVFTRSFGTAMQHVPSPTDVVFYLDNDAIDQTTNDSITQHFKQQYRPTEVGAL